MPAIARGLGLGVEASSPANLATFSVDPSRMKAEIQLLSDMASVECVSTNPDPCNQPSSSASSSAAAPRAQALGQPTNLAAQVWDGTLTLSWSAAAGATAESQ